MEQEALVIVGPTAVGKSALALELAERLGGEIVNADALQAYRRLEIGTGKPTSAERARVPHHLLDVLDPVERYSAGEFARRAREVIAEVAGRGRVPIVVGGSGLYLQALLEGISPLPASDPAWRARLRARAAAEGLPALRAELQRLDPETAARLGAGDTQRILRALEVALSSGLPLSRWIALQPFGRTKLPVLAVGLTLPRAILYDRIARRARGMIERGWVDEVRRLLHEGLDPEAPAFQAIGYRQIVRHVAGEWSLEEALTETVQATRRYAKRQETWFRKRREVVWLDLSTQHCAVAEALWYSRHAGLGETR
ncbi:MAG: tRNA (adenosine(37)-N6)-dimethylallyltransferase MiaA [Acidobacteriota bacterium]